MKNRGLLTVVIALAMPLALLPCAAGAQNAQAQDTQSQAPAPQAAPVPPPDGPPPAGRPDRAWAPRRDWEQGDRHERRDREMDRGPMEGMDRGDSLLPLGLWWRDSQVATRLGITAEQQKHISDMFLQSRLQLIHLHATLQEEQLMLGPLLNAAPFDEAKAMAQIDKIADTRAELEKTNAKMLLNIRGVLTADQWTKLRDHRHEMRQGGWNDRGPQGPPQPNPQQPN